MWQRKFAKIKERRTHANKRDSTRGWRSCWAAYYGSPVESYFEVELGKPKALFLILNEDHNVSTTSLNPCRCISRCNTMTYLMHLIQLCRMNESTEKFHLNGVQLKEDQIGNDWNVESTKNVSLSLTFRKKHSFAGCLTSVNTLFRSPNIHSISAIEDISDRLEDFCMSHTIDQDGCDKRFIGNLEYRDASNSEEHSFDEATHIIRSEILIQKALFRDIIRIFV